MRILPFSLRQARREWRSGELGALAAALAIAAAALSAVGTFTERVEKALAASANELLAADLVVRSRKVIEPAWRERAIAEGLETAVTVEFPTVAFAGDDSLLVQAKAVTDGYPLRGTLLVADQAYGPSRPAGAVPQPGSAWVDPRLPGEIGAEPGSQLEVGELGLQVSGIVALEPDRAAGVFNLAPRVMIHYDDLAASGLLGEGSRVRYRLLIAGDAAALASYRAWLEPQLGPDQRFQSLEDNQQRVSRALDRSQRFLSLAALTAVILAGVAIVISVRRFTERHLDSVAILRCLGAAQRPVLLSFALELLWLALPALLLGVLLGYAAQALLVLAMGDLIPETLPLPGLTPALVAIVTGILALLGYGLPPLLALRQVPPVRVLNRQLGQPSASHLLSYLAPVGFSVALIFWQAGEARLGLAMTGGIIGTVLLLTGTAWVLIRLIRRSSRSRGVSWRFGIANVAKRSGSSLLQVAGLGLGLMVIFLLGVIQSDLLQGWRDSLPPKTPNYFLINIQPQQVESTRSYFAEHDIESQGLFPMAVARLSGINGREPDPEDYEGGRARHEVNDNQNLSWAEELPRGNRIVSGRWWSEDREGVEISLADSWAEIFGLKVGDTLSFTVGAESFQGTITSLREVDWDSFEVNFFILISPGAVGDVPRTYVSSVYLPPERFQAISGLVRLHPNISVLDVGSILGRVRTIIDRVSLTVQFVFGFTLLAGVIVLLATLQSGLSERIYEGAVLRTLGGSRRQLRRAVLSEFALLGAVAGFLAAVAALGVGWVMAREVFGMPYEPSLWLPPTGLLIGAAGIGLTGLWGSRPVLRTPPAVILRKA